METLTQFGVPVLGILIAGGLVWAITQVCKRAIRQGKQKYLLYSAVGAVVVSILVTKTMGQWSWLSFAWTCLGGWICANLGHKFYAKYLKKFLEKEKPAG